MKCRLAQKEIEQGGIISLDGKEEHLFCWDAEKCRSCYGVWWICPYSGLDQVRIPRRGRDDGDGDEEEYFIQTELRRERMVT